MNVILRLLHFGRSPREIQSDAHDVDVRLAEICEANRKTRQQLEMQAEQTMTRWQTCAPCIERRADKAHGKA